MEETEPKRAGPVRRHATSRHMRMASTMGMVIAGAKQQREVQLRDVLAGIYVVSFDRMLRFWPTAAAFEDFTAEHCDWSEPRPVTWFRWTSEFEHPPRTFHVPFTKGFFQFPRKGRITGKMFSQTEELRSVYATAERMSPKKVASFGAVVPLITPELFVLATLRTDGIELGRRLAEAGLRLAELEQVATMKLDQPEKLEF